MNGPEYLYGGQWFDDMGAITLALKEAPALGVDIGRAFTNRKETSDMTSSLMRAGISPYPGEEPGTGE